MKLVSIIIPLLCLGTSLFGMENKYTPANTNIAIVMDGLVSHWGGAPKKEEYIKFLKNFSFSKAKAIATALTLIPQYKSIKQKGIEIKENTPGVANIINELVVQFKQDGYDISELQEDLNRLSMNYKPDSTGIQAVQNVRRQGFTVTGLTNQDAVQHTIFKDKMAQQGADVSALFNKIVCYAAYDSASKALNVTPHYYELTSNIFASKAPIEQVAFFKTLQDLNPGKKTVLFYKDSEDKKSTFSSIAQNLSINANQVSSSVELQNLLDAKLSEQIPVGLSKFAIVKPKGLFF